MPIIEVKLFKGRTLDQKRKLVADITDTVVKSLDVSPEAVRIILQDISKEDLSVAGVLAVDK